MGEGILLVDPASSFVQFVSLVLGRLGHGTIDHAANAELALEKTAHWTPQLIFSEVRLPAMSGLEFCKTFRQGARTPFVFLTTDASPATRSAAIAAGASDLLAKPVNTRALHEVTERLLPFDTRRHHLRTAMVLDVDVRQGNRNTTLRTTTVGEGGLFLETPEPAAVGTALTMRLPLPGLDEPIRLVGEVVHSRPEDLGRGTSGVGVKFVRMDENTRIFMRHYLETYVESGSPPPRREG